MRQFVPFCINLWWKCLYLCKGKHKIQFLLGGDKCMCSKY
uniref:Uncharacterized protein n=1 Tax=Anguilla anguilla TaxID=7936 RepID=A0A0E9UQ18_ANGAN